MWAFFRNLTKDVFSVALRLSIRVHRPRTFLLVTGFDGGGSPSTKLFSSKKFVWALPRGFASLQNIAVAFDSPTQCVQTHCSSPLRKQKAPGKGANVFASGDGGNRTPVQKIFREGSTKFSPFYFPCGNVSCMNINRQRFIQPSL